MKFDVIKNVVCKTLFHHLDCIGILVYQNTIPVVPQASRSKTSRTSKEVKAHIPFLGVNLDDSFKDAQRFLSSIACLFLAIGRDYGMPPYIGRGLSKFLLFLRDKPCGVGQVRDSVDCFIIVGVLFGVLRIEKDVVMLATPFAPASCAPVIRPYDFIDETISPENLINQNLAIMNFPIVEVKEERAIGFEYPIGFLYSWTDEAEKIIEFVIISDK